MAGIIESIQKKKNPYAPMEAMQGPNGLTAPAPETTDNLAPDTAMPKPAPYVPQTGGQMVTKPLQVSGPTPILPPGDVQPDTAMPINPATPQLPPENVQPAIQPIDSAMPITGGPVGLIDGARNISDPAPIYNGPVKGQVDPNAVDPSTLFQTNSVAKSQPFIPKAAADSATQQEPMAAAGASDPNSIEAQMEADRKRQEALTGAGAAATQNSGGAQTGGVMTATGGLLSDGGSGTDFTETATGATGGTAGDGSTAWSPTAGIVDQIKGIDPKTITGTSYDPTRSIPPRTRPPLASSPPATTPRRRPMPWAPMSVGTTPTGTTPRPRREPLRRGRPHHLARRHHHAARESPCRPAGQRARALELLDGCRGRAGSRARQGNRDRIRRRSCCAVQRPAAEQRARLFG
jgi:hypothetical protein